MTAAFDGFSREAFAWFAGLERDNSKAYFTATRELYDSDVRGAMVAMLEELSAAFGGEVRVFRQHRDVRFSPDKSPYKTRTYGLLQGAPGAGGGLYAELSSRGLYAGTGYHQLAGEALERFRQAVVDDSAGAALAAKVAAAREAGLEVVGASLRTAPRGYPRDHPRIELLRHKALIAGRRLPGTAGIGRRAALDHVAGTWRTAAPLNAWLDEHVGPSTRPPHERGRR
jgi:uncharacterized protein (TIGR02453 family)